MVQSRRPPLGLPTGSVRALLALMIISTVVVQTVRGELLPVPMAEALMIVLANYFTTRRVLSLPPDVLARLEQEELVPSEKHPLYLPRFSIRFIILLSFAGVAGYLYQRGELFTERSFSTVGLVFAYFVGMLFGGFGKLFRKWGLPQGLLDWLADMRALAVLGATGTLTVCYWVDRTDVLPPWAESTILSLLLFYFGAR